MSGGDVLTAGALHSHLQNNSCEMIPATTDRLQTETYSLELPMIRRFALTAFAALLLPATAGAATYGAKPVAPVAAKRFVARDITWACSPAYCLGNTGESRPLVLCQGLAKRAGRLESFAVDGRPLASADLDKCNASARGGAPGVARN